MVLTLSHTIPTFYDPTKESFENILGKGENAGNQHFLLFPTILFTLPKTIFSFSVKVILSSANAFNLNLSLISSFVKEVNSPFSNKDQLEHFNGLV